MPTLVKFYSFIEAAMEKKHDFSADTFKILLTNTAPSLSNTQKSDLTEISAGSGYSAGGVTVTTTSSSQSSGLWTWIVADATLTASGGSIGPWRYAVVYNDTSTNDLLVGYLDYGYSVTIASGQTFEFNFDNTSGLLYAS
jgi:hypothetical protein